MSEYARLQASIEVAKGYREGASKSEAASRRAMESAQAAAKALEGIRAEVQAMRDDVVLSLRDRIPEHQVDGTRLRFRQLGGDWGPWIETRGAPGLDGLNGLAGLRGLQGEKGDKGDPGGNVLYQTGSFTPFLYGMTTAGTPLYAASGQQGRFTRIGRLVSVQLHLNVQSVEDVAGQMAIGGLPFARNTATPHRGILNIGQWTGFTLPSGTLGLYGMIWDAGTNIRLFRTTLTVGNSSLQVSVAGGTGFTLYGQMVYETTDA